MRGKHFFAIIIVFFFASCSTLEKDLNFRNPEGLKKNIRIALIPFADANNVKNSGINVSDAITNELLKISRWDVVERTQIEKIIKEQAFEATGMTEKDYAKLGKLANVDYFITGSLGQYESYVDKKDEIKIRIAINLRFIDTTSGKVIGGGRYVYNTNRNYLRSCCLFSWIWFFLPDNTIDKELSKVAREIVADIRTQLGI